MGECEGHTKLTFEEAWFNFVFYIFVSPLILEEREYTRLMDFLSTA